MAFSASAVPRTFGHLARNMSCNIKLAPTSKRSFAIHAKYVVNSAVADRHVVEEEKMFCYQCEQTKQVRTNIYLFTLKKMFFLVIAKKCTAVCLSVIMNLGLIWMFCRVYFAEYCLIENNVEVDNYTMINQLIAMGSVVVAVVV